MRLRILVGLAALAFGGGLALLLVPREREVRVIFAAGDSAAVDGQWVQLPHRLEFDPDADVHLVLLNNTGRWRYAGTVAVPPRDSAHIGMESCIPQGGPTGVVPLR